MITAVCKVFKGYFEFSFWVGNGVTNPDFIFICVPYECDENNKFVACKKYAVSDHGKCSQLLGPIFIE